MYVAFPNGQMFGDAAGSTRYGMHAIGWALSGVLFLAWSAHVPAQAPRPETAIKAEFVLRFPEFVEWPQGPAEGRPVTLCLSPSQPFGSAVQASVARLPRSRRIVVRQLQDRELPRTCDVVYVAAGDLALLDSVANLPILTVGDHPNFCQRGGIINLLVIDGRVRFEIELARARRSGLKLDSQLLRLASRVYGGLP